MAKEVYKTKEESVKAYREYIENHIKNVKTAFDRYGFDIFCYANSRNMTNELFSTYSVDNHDLSKYSEEEFEAYRANFHPCEEDLKAGKKDIEDAFEAAWEHHYTHNQHHPEYWTVKINDQATVVRMSNRAFVEMVCDWIAMSMNFKESTFEWWQKSRDKKRKYFTKEDFELIDKLMEEYKDKYDFSEK